MRVVHITFCVVPDTAPCAEPGVFSALPRSVGEPWRFAVGGRTLTAQGVHLHVEAGKNSASPWTRRYKNMGEVLVV